ncbi:hypothetical protein BaRGS_00002130, partial [Batillaria attramentaria]
SNAKLDIDFIRLLCEYTLCRSSYPRFVINSNPFTSAFGPFLPTADSMPPLLPPAPAGPSAADAAHCHRIYELQKGSQYRKVFVSRYSGYTMALPFHQLWNPVAIDYEADKVIFFYALYQLFAKQVTAFWKWI